jgi:FtsH-binding integral membrane protein
MEKSTKIALLIAAGGYGVSKYESSKIKGSKTYLETSESQAKMLGNLTTVLALSSAVIFETTKNSPKARKISFIGLGGLTIAGFAALFYALKKMT